MLLLLYAKVQFDLKCSVNLISLILRLFSFLLLFKCEQTFQIVALCDDCLPNFQHVNQCRSKGSISGGHASAGGVSH